MKNCCALFLLILSFTLGGCGGGGGAASSGAVESGYPASIERSSSYDFRQAFPLANPQVLASALSTTVIADAETRNTLTFGDFLWEGANGVAGFIKINTTSGNGKAVIVKKQNGNWVVVKTFDLDALLPGASCTLASRAITVDLNNDKRHDVFVTCKGRGTAEHQLLFLSGTSPDAYQVSVLKDTNGTALTFQASQASVADLDGNGAMDIVLSDRTDVKFLMGQASASLTDRRFTPVTNRLIYTSTTPNVTLPSTEIHGVELIPHPDTARRFDLVVMSSTNNGYPTWLIKGDTSQLAGGTNFYAARAEPFPFTNTSSPGEVVDVLHDGTYGTGFYYLNMQNASRSTMKIVKVPDSLAASSTVLPANTYADGVSAQLVFTNDGKVSVQDGDCAETVALDANSRCAINATK